jgi:hypothetical protein
MNSLAFANESPAARAAKLEALAAAAAEREAALQDAHFPSRSEVAASLAAAKAAAIPIPERVFTTTNIAATLALGGAGDRAAGAAMLEEAAELKGAWAVRGDPGPTTGGGGGGDDRKPRPTRRILPSPTDLPHPSPLPEWVAAASAWEGVGGEEGRKGAARAWGEWLQCLATVAARARGRGGVGAADGLLRSGVVTVGARAGAVEASPALEAALASAGCPGGLGEAAAAAAAAGRGDSALALRASAWFTEMVDARDKGRAGWKRDRWDAGELPPGL